VTVAQRIVEILIGRLITDDQFRIEFLNDPQGTLLAIRDRGFDLTLTEVEALADTDRSVWAAAAEQLDPRLRKASLLSIETMFPD
jgi:hypothetical protein